MLEVVKRGQLGFGSETLASIWSVCGRSWHRLSCRNWFGHRLQHSRSSHCHGCAYLDSGTDMDTDGGADVDTYPHMDTSGDMDTRSCSVPHAESRTNEYSDTVANTGADGNSDSCSDSHAESCTNEYSDTVANADTGADGNSDSCSCAHTDTHAAPDEHSHAFADTNPHTASDKHTYSNSIHVPSYYRLRLPICYGDSDTA